MIGSYDTPLRDRELWRDWAGPLAEANAACVEDAKRERDQGTCVLGAGVALYVIPPRGRVPRLLVVVDAPFQGNVGSHKACARALEILRAAGLDAFWYDGRMD